jgi:hypothetical protein
MAVDRSSRLRVLIHALATLNKVISTWPLVAALPPAVQPLVAPLLVAALLLLAARRPELLAAVLALCGS